MEQKKTTGIPEKNIITVQGKNCSRSKKENFVYIKNIETTCGCSLQYENN